MKLLLLLLLLLPLLCSSSCRGISIQLQLNHGRRRNACEASKEPCEPPNDRLGYRSPPTLFHLLSCVCVCVCVCVSINNTMTNLSPPPPPAAPPSSCLPPSLPFVPLPLCMRVGTRWLRQDAGVRRWKSYNLLSPACPRPVP
jgi:hypothetical protein